jgi:hypothetical protein
MSGLEIGLPSSWLRAARMQIARAAWNAPLAAGQRIVFVP